jgi:hypothetical protein
MPMTLLLECLFYPPAIAVNECFGYLPQAEKKELYLSR